MSHPEFSIAGRSVGYKHEPLVIAEIGINHNGDLNIAKKMVDAAHSGGAEIIKHQTHIIEDEMSSEARSIKPDNAGGASIYDVMDQAALNEADELELKQFVESKGMIFISTPFSRAAVDRLVKFDVPAFKIGSGECNNYPLVDYIARRGKPIILSTGMNRIDEIRRTVEIIRKHSTPFALLHCTNVYPTPYKDVRLGGMMEIAESFPDAVIGLSDHTLDNYACLGAVALGASILERHFTDSHYRKGPDVVCSMDPVQLADLKKGARALQLARGGQKDTDVKGEKTVKDFAFASVVTIRPVKKDEEFTLDNIWVKRPGTGRYNASDFEQILGKKALISIDTDTQLNEGHVVL